MPDRDNPPTDTPDVPLADDKGVQHSRATLGFTDPRVSAIARFLIFLFLVRFILVPIAFSAIRPFRPAIEAWVGDIGEAILLVCVLLATFVMAKLERRSFFDFGLSGSQRLSKFFVGVLAGFTALTVMLLALRAGGDFRFGRLHMHGSALAIAAVGNVVGFALVALFEETAFRGYALYTLARGIRFWPAAIVISVLFAFSHTQNPGESSIGIAAVFAFGLVLAFSVWRTGSLLWGIGFHFMWDYSETFIYGVPDSGFVSPQHLLSAHFHGPAWITGGSVGPEGSYFIFLVLAAIAVTIHVLYPNASLSFRTK